MKFPCMFLPVVHYSIKCHLIWVMSVEDNSLRWVLFNKLLTSSPTGCEAVTGTIPAQGHHGCLQWSRIKDGWDQLGVNWFWQKHN